MSHKKLIHIGYHKTASTWLQHQLLNNPDANFERYMKKGQIQKHIVEPHPLDFDAEAVKEFYETLVPENPEHVSVISSERLSGNPHSGGFDSKEIAERLHAVFPDAKVLIVIREQIDAIASCYLQYVKFGGSFSLKDYLSPETKRGSAFIPSFSFKHFNYARLINHYIKLFGKENVLVLTYESFRDNPSEFCKQVTEHAGAKELEGLPFSRVRNKRISTFSANISRQLNKVFSKNMYNHGALNLQRLRKLSNKQLVFFDSLLPKSFHKAWDKKHKSYIKDLIQGEYKECNQELSKLLDKNLEEYGYQV